MSEAYAPNTTRYPGNICRRLPSTATKEEIAERHRNKMEWKADERERAYARRRKPQVFANLSRRHPDSGCTPKEHARRKAEGRS